MNAKEKTGPTGRWFEILLACRQFDEKRRPEFQEAGRECYFTAEDIAAFAKIQDAAEATAAGIASAWLAKFSKWGYLERGEPVRIAGKVGRPTTTYRLTKLGWECEERVGRLTRLIKAVRDFEESYGTKKENDAFLMLTEVREQVELNKDGDR